MDHPASGSSSEPLQPPVFTIYASCDHGEERPKRSSTLTSLDVFFSLVKANLAQGILALPYVFGRAGWAFGFPIMIFVVVQGVYCMVILAKCCYINLVASDLVQHLGILNRWTMLILLAPFFAALALARFVAQLSLINRLGVLAMTVAVVTSVVCGVQHLLEEDWQAIEAGALPFRPFTDSILLCASVFFAFEGIGVVLPIVNEMEEPSEFPQIANLGAAALGLANISVASTCGIAFRNELQTGSIVAFLALRPGASFLVHGASWLVTIAVFMTYPVGTVPAAQILAKYAGDSADTDTSRVPPWVRQRLVLLLCQLLVAASVRNVALLVALVGAVGQTGLGLMSPLCHFALMRSGVMPMNYALALIDVVIMGFCVLVMIFGSFFAVCDIVAEW